MKTLHTIYTNFAKRIAVVLTILLTVGVSAVWGQQVAWDFASSDTQLSNLRKNPISVSYAKNNGTLAVAISNSAFRLYKGSSSSTNGCSATFTIDNGYKIESITVVFADGRTSARGKIDNGSYEDVFSAGSSKTVTISSLSAQSYSIQNQGTNTVAISSITITYSSDTSTPADLYVVTLMDDTDNPLSQTSAGGTVTLPERDGCTGYTFAGWTQTWTEKQEEWTTTAPDIIEAGTYTPKTNEFLYPVYAKTEGGGSGFKLSVTIDDGTIYYIGTSISSYLSAVKDIEDAATFNIEGNQYLYYGNKTYVSSNANNTSLTIGTQTPSATWSISESDETITFKSNGTGGRYLAFNYNSGSPRFSSYTDNASYPHTLTKHNTSTISYISVPNCCTQLAEVTDLEFSSITSNSITVGVPNTYAGKANASGYTFNCYSASTGGSLVATADKNGTSHTFTGLTKNTPYYFTVIAKGEGDYCNSAETSPRESSKTLAQYTVTLNPNGGTGDFTGWHEEDGNYTQTIEKGNSVTLPKLDDQIAYTFGGWSDGTTTYDAGIYTPEADLELTAVWNARQLINYRTLCEYEVTWLIGGEEYIAGTPTTTVQAGKTITTLPTNPTDNALGCCSDKFMGWTTSTAKTIEDQYLYETIEEIQAKFPSIYEDLTFRAVFATTAQGVGTSIADFSQMGYENNTAVTTPIILGDGEGHGDATITLQKAQSSSNEPTYYTDGEAVRIYAGGTITIASTYNNATIKNIVFTFAGNDVVGENTITASSGTYDNGTWTGDASTVTFTISGSTGHRRIASITVTTGVSGSQYTNYVTQCTTLPNPALSGGSVPAIAVNCGDFSTLNNSQAITFSTMQDLTCPVTFEVIDGDFLISTAKDRAAQYQSKVKVTPYKTSENTGKLKNVYVRANATDHNENFTGKIKVTSDEIAEDVIINLTADVTCEAFTITTVDHLGNKLKEFEYYAGVEVAEIAAPTTDNCSKNYTFDGWSTSEVEYGSVAYSKVTFPYTMPAKDVILYPVYQCNKTADYHRVTSDLGANNWAGDYLIANAPTTFVNGKTSALNVADMSGEGIIVNEVISAYYGDPIHVSLISVEGGYVLKTQDNEKPYVYITPAGTSTTTNANLTTADNNPLSVTYNSESDILITNPQNTLGYALEFYSTKFGFYKAGSKIYLYRKSPLYTSSLICEEITAENAMVTSTADQIVKVNVTAAMSNMTVNRPRTLTVESDNTDFTATITETATNTYNVAVSYTPSAEDNTDGKETATITINVNDIPVTTFQVTGRHLPENFVIAAKWGDNWYALPANCVNSGDSKQGVLIDVNDINNPTSAIAPTTTKYGLCGVKPGRQTTHGQSILFTERVSGKQYALYQNNGETENIWVYAQYANYDNQNPTYYEWIPSTNDLTNYTFTHTASSRKLGVNENGVFGAYTTDVQVRLLPATFYDQVAVQVIKWKENSVIVMYTGAATTATTQVGTHDATAQTLANQEITHGIYELTTTQSLTENAGKILTMCFGTAQVKVEIPLIVNGTTTASKNGHDVVILDGGKLTASTTLYSYKNVYVYGGGKLAIPTGTQLGVKNIILRAGGVATNGAGKDPTYQHIYPQVELKGTLSTPTNASGFMKYEYVTDYDHWYHLVLPFDAQYNTITYPQEYYGDNVTSNNTGSWQIKRYAGEIRATGNYDAWVDIETENANTVTAGKGYIYWAAPKKVTVNGSKERQKWGIQRITLGKTPSVATTEENKEKKISGLSSYATIQGNSGKDNDQGWNLIGNPYMMNLSNMDETGLQVGKLVEEKVNDKWTGRWEWLNNGVRYLTIPSDHFDTYTAKTISAATPLVAGRAFFVQLADDANAVTFKAENRPNLMPALRATTQIEKDIETGIILSNETMQDEMNFWIKDGKTNEYEYNADYPKTPNNNRFNIYGVHTNGDLSWVAISPGLAAESMPIGYQVPAAGTYMLSLSETYYSDDLQALYVTDHAMSPEITVDLMTNNYYFDVNQAETNDTRFTVSLQVKSSGNGGVTTDNENIDVDKNQPIKFIYQDKLYILRNGVIYDGTGKQVQTINK